jgi:integrase
LTDALIAELREWRLACPIGADDLIFPNLDGKPLCHSNLLQRGFLPGAAARWPCVRSGSTICATHSRRFLLANGEDVVRVSRLSGHSSPKITLDV